MKDKEKFHQQVKDGLRGLDRQQVVHFAWRSAMRALPFLGATGDFDFWTRNERQKHLNGVFGALDAAANNYDANADDDAAYAAAYAADDAAYAANAANAAAANAANAAAYAAYAADDAAANAAANAAYAADRYNMDLRSVILSDIVAIKEGKETEEDNPTAWYGPVWAQFQKALSAEKCDYWGRLYQRLFDDHLQFRPESLAKRLNVPKEIRAQGASAVGYYLEELEKGARRLNEARIIILGDKGAGKTCLARRLKDPKAPMTTDEESTAGVDTTIWELADEDINVSIWDFAGHTVTHAVHQFFLSERCLYIMVYDGRTEDRNRLEYWLDHMKNYGGDSQAMILVNKRDQHSVDIPINYLKEHYAIAGKVEFSIRDDAAALGNFRKRVSDYIISNPSWKKQEIPESYYSVKEDLEKLFAKQGDGQSPREHISKCEFSEIAEKYSVEDIEELLKDLHSLGVSLWYQEMSEFDTLVLNPEWISHGVYKIINWVNEHERHSIKLDDFQTIFKKDASRYPQEKHSFLFKLMKHYELAYETAEESLIIPHLLKEDRPEELPHFPVGDSLMLRYQAEQTLPPHTISRFIVRHHHQIKKEGDYLEWRYGVVLGDGKGTTAMVREEERTISVSVKGSDQTEFIGELRETLNAIFDSYKSDKPELQYRIERFGQLPEELEVKNPLWLPDSKIINHAQKGRPYYDDVTDLDLPMKPVMLTYNIAVKAENVIMGGKGHQIIQNTFNFRDCNLALQGNLNDLATLLTEGNYLEEAEELKNAANLLETVEDCENKDEVKKKGIASRLKRILEELGDGNSKLHKAVKKVKNGVGVVKDLAKGYNSIAQWAGLPQVPEPFLKKK